MMPHRPVEDDAVRERRQASRDHDEHVRHQGLEDAARFDPAHWGTCPVCPMCGRPFVDRVLICHACGDAEDMAA